MSDTNPLTAGGFAPSPIYPDDLDSDDDNWLLQDFLQARALAQTHGVMARLDAFAAAQGISDGPPPVNDATSAAPPPPSTPQTTTDESASDRSPSSSAQPPPVPDAGPHDPPPPTASAPAFPLFTPDPYFDLDDGDTTPFGLKLQCAAEKLARSTPDAGDRTNWGLLTQGIGHEVSGVGSSAWAAS
jgi:hypothetical protein